MKHTEILAIVSAKWRRWLGWALAAALLAYAGVCLSFYLRQDGIVFTPSRALVATPRKYGLAFEDLWLTAADGTRVHAWYVAGTPEGREVLLLHGNGGNISHYLRTMLALHRQGHGVLAVDYRGYGRSEGRPSEEGAYQDAAAAFDHLVLTRRVPADHIVVYGRSLGGAVATWLAAHRAPGALVLESTFTRLTDVGQARYPWLPVTLLSRNRFDSLAQIRRVRCPILISHGRNDTVVPARFGRALAAAAGPRARFISLPGDHSDAFLRGGADYLEDLRRFISSAGA
ncbi:MAG: lysophospholipase [Gammaproteobacteria bacterium]|nr:lysophospholipase [Gammaproteobacteria bacterium]